MKKKLLIVGAGLLSITVLAGCSQEPIFFEGKQMEVDRVEEVLSDRLEDENGIEFDVKISEDMED